MHTHTHTHKSHTHTQLPHTRVHTLALTRLYTHRAHPLNTQTQTNTRNAHEQTHTYQGLHLGHLDLLLASCLGHVERRRDVGRQRRAFLAFLRLRTSQSAPVCARVMHGISKRHHTGARPRNGRGMHPSRRVELLEERFCPRISPCEYCGTSIRCEKNGTSSDTTADQAGTTGRGARGGGRARYRRESSSRR